jgi:hypothetical protein
MFCKRGAEREGGLEGKQQTLNTHKDMAIKYSVFYFILWGGPSISKSYPGNLLYAPQNALY